MAKKNAYGKQNKNTHGAGSDTCTSITPAPQSKKPAKPSSHQAMKLPISHNPSKTNPIAPTKKRFTHGIRLKRSRLSAKATKTKEEGSCKTGTNPRQKGLKADR